MSYTVAHQMEKHGPFFEGDVILTNHPGCGGSHLPDITVITPVFYQSQIAFFTACRAHHADIGGVLAGSMPPNSKWLFEEGAAIKSLKIVRNGEFDFKAVQKAFVEEPSSYPGCDGCRNFRYIDMSCQNYKDFSDTVSDLKAQIAANQRGVYLMENLIQEFGLQVVVNNMTYVRNSAELAVRNLIKRTSETYGSVLSAEDFMDDGSCIRLTIRMNADDGSASFDFNGTSPQVFGNWNAPKAVILPYSCLLSRL